MNWWGKLLGGTFGFMLGGPLGALLGAALGNYFDAGLAGLEQDERLGIGVAERVQTAFFATTFSVMGYLAKADGQVTRDEIDMAERVMRQMRLDARQRQVAINLFSAGKGADFDLNQVLQQFKRECHRRTNLVLMFLEILIATALADGQLHAQERQVLERIASELGVNQQQFRDLLGRISGQAHFQEQESIEDRLKAAYELLGVNPSASEEEIKRAYRRQMNQHHPDKLVAKGLPEEMMEIAKQQTQDIKSAYELIKANR